MWFMGVNRMEDLISSGGKHLLVQPNIQKFPVMYDKYGFYFEK